jgi:hypothetical protein
MPTTAPRIVSYSLAVQWERWIGWKDSNRISMGDNHVEECIASSLALGRVRRAVRFACRSSKTHEQ